MVTEGNANVVVVDANVAINFIHIGRLDLLGRLPGLRFVIPEHVAEEISDDAQSAVLREAIEAGLLEEIKIIEPAELMRYSQLIRTLGKGESACLAIAESRGWLVASDESRAFRRTAIDCLGEQCLVTTPDLIVRAIQTGLATVGEADQWKRTLELNRFKMKFESFSELL